MDPDPDLGKFKAGSGVNHSGSAILLLRVGSLQNEIVSQGGFTAE